ncbi:hypothetical protein AMS68_003490 [Peltaster fructicola]|uniref:DNA-directed RNA polymerase subunit n=1 Tax=Peltaster fructicola TaxID=286661 RepID=A0A6H0XTC2_9PEZI|nr:hypothetical protein AMS68_003490 [Peltaster fructicola]
MSSDEPQQRNQSSVSLKQNKKRAHEGNNEQVTHKKQKQASTMETNTATPAPKKQKDKSKKKHGRDTQPAQVDKTFAAVTRRKLSLKEDAPQTQSPFVHETQSLFLGLSPVSHRFPLEGACAEFLSPLLLTYYPPLNGVVLSYSNPRLSQHPEHATQGADGEEKVMGRSIDEYAVTYVWLTAEFLVFRPVIGTVLEGFVNLQNQSILGLLCYNYFNAGIEQSRLPGDWRWVEKEELEDDTDAQGEQIPQSSGHYVDASGEVVEGKVLFKVKDFEASAGMDGGTSSINIFGTLLRDQDDAKVDDELRQHALVS